MSSECSRVLFIFKRICIFVVKSIKSLTAPIQTLSGLGV